MFLPIILVLSLLTGTGCAAMLVMATTNPDQKVRDAYMLFDQQYRPLPAERLIREAIARYQTRNDELGLAEAYRVYGFFFRSAALEKWQKFYESQGFYETNATFSNRYEKSIEYFEKSAALFEKHGTYDKLANVYLNMGFTYEFANQKSQACSAYKKSLIASDRFMKDHPGDLLNLPEGYSTYKEYIDRCLEENGTCPHFSTLLPVSIWYVVRNYG